MSDKRVLFITGASTGIGEATARAAVADGWRVALTARSADKLQALAQDLGSDNALAIGMDVQSYDAQWSAVAKTIDRFGRIDAVFANAGRGGVPGGYSEGDPDAWRDMILTNVYGLAVTLRATLAELKRTRGHLVITSSIAGRRHVDGSVYGATKWAASAIGYNVRGELRGTGVRVTTLEPGMVDTPFFEDPKPDALRPENVADAVLFALGQPASVTIDEVTVLPTPKDA
ncbi:MAG: SDR family oxidoreductase [Pseudomonadota bacterium]